MLRVLIRGFMGGIRTPFDLDLRSIMKRLFESYWRRADLGIA